MVLCVLCSLTINRNQLSITCCLCNLLFHKNCVFNTSDLNSWKCLYCSQNMSPTATKKPVSLSLEELIKSVKSLESKFTQQESKITKKLDETLQLLNNVISENNTLKEKISVLEKKITYFEKTDFCSEVSDRDRRKCNIIIFNAPECTSDSAPDELILVNSIFSSLNLPIKALNAIRLGNNYNKRRPLRVNLPDVNCVNQILKAKSKLRNIETLKHLNIDIDKTKLQQEQFKAVWNTLSERKSRGETNIRIGYIRGQPTIISKN